MAVGNFECFNNICFEFFCFGTGSKEKFLWGNVLIAGVWPSKQNLHPERGTLIFFFFALKQGHANGGVMDSM